MLHTPECIETSIWFCYSGALLFITGSAIKRMTLHDFSIFVIPAIVVTGFFVKYALIPMAKWFLLP